MDEKFKKLIRDKKNIGETISYLRGLNTGDKSIEDTVDKLVTQLGEIELQFIRNRIGYYNESNKKPPLPSKSDKPLPLVKNMDNRENHMKTHVEPLSETYWKDDFIKLGPHVPFDTQSIGSKRPYDKMDQNKGFYYFDFDRVHQGNWYPVYQIDDLAHISNYHESIKKRIKFYCYTHKSTGRLCIYRLNKTDIESKSGATEYYLSDDNNKLYVIDDTKHLVPALYSDQKIQQYWKISDPEFSRKKRYYG